ncbi:DUF2141 domain-containing protein [Microbulbifer spongiae]|uniref:DUF2141 domain-containing protein n=1 Tax=Microbulbifer spongiae TaxID=2944933 RepID=A0ABY9EER8_9GAMM|nr:DUF2141 domain-containing protein [Microbulbifer sp. MI-G]WKD51147.1 DUF2141 domain-containing protein [Microbulbifer sp. MI-G]
MLSAAGQAADLSIEVHNIRNNDAQLMVAVFDTQKAYDNTDYSNAYASYTNRVHGAKLKVTFHNIPAGDYVISLFHDENGNNEMNRNFTNMPTEGYGISSAVNKYDQPDFKRAAIKADSGSRLVSIKMLYVSLSQPDVKPQASAKPGSNQLGP